ncbi:MAG TPA: YfhO family protein, partial [Anaerolineae bacterium]|nr:YfhO family protein [Anaerolineae bacterium]
MRRIIPICFIIALIILAPIIPNFGDHLIYPAHSEFSDLTITHWPAFAYARDEIVTTGQVPMWRTSILSGTPFAADPLAGLFYPPHWLALILPLPITFNLLMLLHLALAAASMYAMMRRWNVSRVGSIVSAIAYAAAPKVIAHMGVGHVTLVEAWAWLPVVIAGLNPLNPDDIRNRLHAAQRPVIRGVGWRVGSGLALAMCLLADARIAIYAAALAVTYLIVQHARRDRSTWLMIIMRVMIIVVVAVSVSAMSWLPTLSMTGGTARASITAEEAGTQSLDPIYFLGIVIADRSGAAERTTYFGIVILMLALVGVKLFYRRASRRVWWLIGVIIIGAIVALGLNTPLYRVWLALPGMTLLRVPARAWFIVTFAIAALAGMGTQGLIEWSGQAKPRSIFVAIIVAFAALVFGAIGALGSGQISFVAIALWIPIACLLLILRLKHKLSPDRFAILIVALIAIDLISIDWALY